MFSRTKRTVEWILAIVAVGVLCSTAALAKKPESPSYNIIKLDDMNGLLEGWEWAHAHDINESRLIVGTVKDSTHARAAYWTVTQTRRSVESTLHFLDDGGITSTGASGCNEAGEIVGGGLGTPLYWANPESEALPLPLPTGSLGVARAISNDGVIVGVASDEDGNKALVWRVTETGIWGPLVLESDLDAGARAVSDQVDDVVTVAGESNGSAVTWTVTLTVDGGLVLDSASILSDSAEARGINNLGLVCGFSRAFNEAVVWIDGDPWIWILDRAKPPNSYPAGVPYDINDDGVIVGEARDYPSLSTVAVVWSSLDADMVRLNKYLKGNSPFSSLTSAEAVSESGEIVGRGWISDIRFHAAFLAIPK